MASGATPASGGRSRRATPVEINADPEALTVAYTVDYVRTDGSEVSGDVVLRTGLQERAVPDRAGGLSAAEDPETGAGPGTRPVAWWARCCSTSRSTIGLAAWHTSQADPQPGAGALPTVVENAPASVPTTDEYGPVGGVSLVFAGTEVRDGLTGTLEHPWIAVVVPHR